MVVHAAVPLMVVCWGGRVSRTGSGGGRDQEPQRGGPPGRRGGRCVNGGGWGEGLREGWPEHLFAFFLVLWHLGRKAFAVGWMVKVQDRQADRQTLWIDGTKALYLGARALEALHLGR